MDVTQASETPGAWETLTNRAAPADSRSLGRWIALDGADPVGAVEARVRPDERTFLSIHGRNEAATVSLVQAARESLGRPLYVVVRDGHSTQRRILADLGFQVALTEDVFRVGFRQARAAAERAWVPRGHSIRSASTVDAGQLFELDNRLRRLVPGTEEWIGDRTMFEHELAESPPFDPSGYLVGLDDRSRALTGLVRFWRNPSAPRLGMLAVLPMYRSTTLGPALLKHGLEAASRWGSAHFVTEAARSNRHVHRRLRSLEAERLDSFEVMRL